MPFITQTAIGKRSELSVYGDDYPTRDGTAIRDYIHVMDLAEAHVSALKRLLSQNENENYEVFNLGTGNGNTVLEVIKSFEKVSEKDLAFNENYPVIMTSKDCVKCVSFATEQMWYLSVSAKINSNFYQQLESKF